MQQRESWLYTFLIKILQSDEAALSLLDTSASSALAALHTTAKKGARASMRRAPRLVKVDMWQYRMNAPLWELGPKWWRGKEVVWWQREYTESLIPPVKLDRGTGRLVLASAPTA